MGQPLGRGAQSPLRYSTGKAGRRNDLASHVGSRFRVRRFEQFLELTGATPATRIVDVGCGSLGLRALAPDFNVVGVDREARTGYPGPFHMADVLDGLPFYDREFDLAYCSSVIEHVPLPDRETFASEVRRVARGWYVQTPAIPFPIDTHSVLPFAHWLPVNLRRHYWKLGLATGWENIQLLRKREMKALFGPVVAERLGPFPKSWLAVRVPDRQPTAGGHR